MEAASVTDLENSLETSVDRTTTALGSADKHTDVRNTIPINSESSICSSRAAASSSLAIANDTAKDKSEPIEDKASEAATPFGIAIPSNLEVSGHVLAKDEIKRAATEGFTITRNGALGPLRLRRFVFSSVGKSKISKKRQRCHEGVRVRDRSSVSSASKKSRSNSHQDFSARGARTNRTSICFATTFGATLKTVLDFAGIGAERKRVVAEALDDMASYLSPVSKNIEHIHGADRGHLINGLATRTVGRRQSKHLKECKYDKKLRRTWLYKSGQANVTLGATAAILVSHYVLAVAGAQPMEVIENLERSITTTRNLLDLWNTSVFAADKMYVDALGAEIRALERARASAIAAAEIAFSQKLDRLSSLHLQLRYMRDAAWPAHSVCERGPSHLSNLEQLKRGEPIVSSTDGEDGEDGENEVAEEAQSTMMILNQDLNKIGYTNQADDLESESDMTSSSASSSYCTQSSASIGESDDEEESDDDDDDDDDDDEEEERGGVERPESRYSVKRTMKSLAECMN